MKAHSSPLNLKGFFVLNSKFAYRNLPENNKKSLKDIVESYIIDIDFSHEETEEGFEVFTKISVNDKKNVKPGYSIFAEGVGVFELDKDSNLSDAEIQNLINYSTLTINISYLRAVIENITFRAPWGRYILPAIDMPKLFEAKTEQVSIEEK